MTATNQNQTMTDYKKYSLENLDNWIHDAISCSEASPQEIYDVIYNAVSENYYHHKHQTGRAYELMCLLNGNGNKTQNNLSYYEMIEGGYTMTDDGFWVPPQKDKVIKWQLPVEVDGLTGECYINFPDDLLEAANLKEGDQVKWIDNGDGSFTIRKA